jgi:hypothetical protein
MSGNETKNEIRSLKAEIRRLRKSLKELTPSLPALLRRRGFRIYKKEPPDDLLLPPKRFTNDYYRSLTRYSFRLFLRDVIKRQELFAVKDVTRYSTQEVTADYVRFLVRIGLIETKISSSVILPLTKGGSEGYQRCFRLKKTPVKSFGPTLEWFLSEILKREFAAEAIWGIKFKRPAVGGDYDVIAKIDGSLLYAEVKSSPPKQVYAGEISAFFDRVFDLSPEITIFFMDTELRMKDKIVPMFEEEMRKRPPQALFSYLAASEIPPVERIEKELFQIGKKIFIINAKDSIVNNVEKVLSRYFRGI